MSSFHRQNLYSDATPDDVMDMSGFMSDMPVDQDFIVEPRQPTVTQRERSSSNASGTVGYVVPNPIMPDEPDDPGYHYALSPFWADESGLAPRAAAVSKTVGLVGMVLSGTYAAAKRREGGSPYAKAAFAGSSALYVHPALGVNHGLLKVMPGKDHWIAKYPRYGGIGVIHVLAGYGFYKGISNQIRYGTWRS